MAYCTLLSFLFFLITKRYKINLSISIYLSLSFLLVAYCTVSFYLYILLHTFIYLRRFCPIQTGELQPSCPRGSKKKKEALPPVSKEEVEKQFSVR